MPLHLPLLLTKHPAAAAAAAGGALGLVVLARAKSKGAGTSSAAGDGTGPLGYVLPAGSNAGSATDLLGSVEGQVADLAQQLQNYQAPTPALPTPDPPATTPPAAPFGVFPTGEPLNATDAQLLPQLMTARAELVGFGTPNPTLEYTRERYQQLQQWFLAHPDQFHAA